MRLKCSSSFNYNLSHFLLQISFAFVHLFHAFPNKFLHFSSLFNGTQPSLSIVSCFFKRFHAILLLFHALSTFHTFTIHHLPILFRRFKIYHTFTYVLMLFHSFTQFIQHFLCLFHYFSHFVPCFITCFITLSFYFLAIPYIRFVIYPSLFHAYLNLYVFNALAFLLSFYNFSL